MKHSTTATFVLVAIFIVAQMTGLIIVNSYIDQEATEESGKVVYKDLPVFERPQVEETFSFVWILLAVILGTILLLVIIHFRSVKVWKTWYFIAIALCLMFAFGAFMSAPLAAIGGLLFTLWKIRRPNVVIHNLTEIFIYGGLAAIFVPIMNLFSVVALLILISIYDAFAVWQSKHMVKMAKFQSKAQVFAGLSIPYKIKDLVKKRATAHKTHNAAKHVPEHKPELKSKAQKHSAPKHIDTGMRTAILGGGDIGFPLMFAGVVMKSVGMTKVLVIPFATAVALLLLLTFAQKEKFYPAMPFLSAGCFVGYGIVLLL